MAAHPIVHIEFPATDTKAASQFYADVFNWQIQVAPEFNYHMFSAEGGPGGGFVEVREPTAEIPITYKVGEPLIYIGSDDIEGDLQRITAHGGTVVAPKMEIPQTGWFAIFTDPSGNKVALYTAMTPQG